jgi:hypothetical protein
MQVPEFELDPLHRTLGIERHTAYDDHNGFLSFSSYISIMRFGRAGST